MVFCPKVIDGGAGKMLKHKTGENLRDRMEDKSVEELASMTASDRRVEMTWAAGESWKKVCETYDFEKAFDERGLTIGRGGPPDGVELKFEYMDRMKTPDGTPYKFTYTLDDLPEGRGGRPRRRRHSRCERRARRRRR